MGLAATAFAAGSTLSTTLDAASLAAWAFSTLALAAFSADFSACSASFLLASPARSAAADATALRLMPVSSSIFVRVLSRSSRDSGLVTQLYAKYAE